MNCEVVGWDTIGFEGAANFCSKMKSSNIFVKKEDIG